VSQLVSLFIQTENHRDCVNKNISFASISSWSIKLHDSWATAWNKKPDKSLLFILPLVCTQRKHKISF